MQSEGVVFNTRHKVWMHFDKCERTTCFIAWHFCQWIEALDRSYLQELQSHLPLIVTDLDRPPMSEFNEQISVKIVNCLNAFSSQFPLGSGFPKQGNFSLFYEAYFGIILSTLGHQSSKWPRRGARGSGVLPFGTISDRKGSLEGPLAGLLAHKQ